MSFTPSDKKAGNAATVQAATGLAAGVAGLAGANTQAVQLASAAVNTTAGLQAGGGLGVLGAGVTSLAGVADPRLGQALQLGGQAQALLGQKPPAGDLLPIAKALPAAQKLTEAVPAAKPLTEALPAAVTVTKALADAPAIVEKLLIAEHPLAGQAVNDFATPEPDFMPAAIDPELAPSPAETEANTLANFTEGNRLLRFYSPLPASKALLINSLTGRAALSEPFEFQLSLLSKNAAIDLQDMMGKNVSVGVQLADGSEHFINGYVNSFAATNSDGGFAFYHAEIVPWFSYLKRRVNSRIFQDMDVFEVLDTIFKGDYKGLAKYEYRTSRNYKPENYIVQYDETDDNFASRLMEKNGLFYYFEHGPKGHLMVISDNSCDATFCPPQDDHAEVQFNDGNRWQDQDGITSLAAERHLQSTKLALNTFDFKAPNSMQYVELPTSAKQGDVPSMEVYDGNGAFSYKNRDAGLAEARMRMEVLEWQAKIFTGSSDCRGLTAGHTLKLLEHHWFDPTDGTDNDFLIVSVQYDARNNYFDRDVKDVYRNTFSAIRRKIPYRPLRAHKQPRMPGPQTATVVGPKGQEIHTDQFGRIKVHFHWDRYGRHDDRSSCWVRVSQPWAGQGWGTISIPRVGQEVIIDYLEGDPDRPVSTGRLYNADQPAPYALPAGAHMMGFKSRSTPGGAGFSEMVIHDSKGAELINIHSQKDMVTTVQNTQATLVNGPFQTNTVSRGYHVTTVNQQIEMTSQTAHLSATAEKYITLTANTQYIHQRAKTNIELEAKTAHIHQTAETDIALKSKTAHIHQTAETNIELKAKTAHLHQTAETNIELKAKTAHIHQTADTNIELKAKNAHIHQTAKADIDIKSEASHIHLTASTDITLEVGASKIELRKDGTITISGVNVNVIGSGRIDLNT
ncbi:MAG: type VI secretion system tip protein TssI/VgrG [Telluria sp.]